MSAQENARVARRWFEEVLSQGRLEVIDEILSAEARFTRAGPGAGLMADARRRARAYAAAYRTAFPDLRVTVDDLVACGDAVTLCWTSAGTHTGHFTLPEAQAFGLPPTGRAARWSGISLFRLADGRIVETRTHGEAYNLLRQLGLVPPPGRVEPGS